VTLIFDLNRRVIDHAGGCVPGRERRGVDERLERRARLTLGIERPIEPTLHRSPAADEGPDGAGPGVQRHHRSLDVGSSGSRAGSPALNGRRLDLYGPLGCTLRGSIESGMYDEVASSSSGITQD
jgi:hypothetical protein